MLVHSDTDLVATIFVFYSSSSWYGVLCESKITKKFEHGKDEQTDRTCFYGFCSQLALQTGNAFSVFVYNLECC